MEHYSSHLLFNTNSISKLMHMFLKLIRRKRRLGSPLGSKDQVKVNEFVNIGTKFDAFIPNERKVKFEVSLSLEND